MRPVNLPHHTILEESAYVFTFCGKEKEWQPYTKNDKFISRTLSVLHPYDIILTHLSLYGWVETKLLHLKNKILHKELKRLVFPAV